MASKGLLKSAIARLRADEYRRQWEESVATQAAAANSQRAARMAARTAAPTPPTARDRFAAAARRRCAAMQARAIDMAKARAEVLARAAAADDYSGKSKSSGKGYDDKGDYDDYAGKSRSSGKGTGASSSGKGTGIGAGDAPASSDDDISVLSEAAKDEWLADLRARDAALEETA